MLSRSLDTFEEAGYVYVGVRHFGLPNDALLDAYDDLLNQGRLPVVRGLALTFDDLLRRVVIMALGSGVSMMGRTLVVVAATGPRFWHVGDPAGRRCLAGQFGLGFVDGFGA
jgi:hypothetical protein